MVDVIFPTFLLFLQFQCCAMPFIYVNVFREDLKRGSVESGMGTGVVT